MFGLLNRNRYLCVVEMKQESFKKLKQ